MVAGYSEDIRDSVNMEDDILAKPEIVSFTNKLTLPPASYNVGSITFEIEA